MTDALPDVIPAYAAALSSLEALAGELPKAPFPEGLFGSLNALTSAVSVLHPIALEQAKRTRVASADARAEEGYL